MDDNRKLILQTIEEMLASQLRAVRQMMRKESQQTKSTVRVRASKISLVEDVLERAGKPLHINDILKQTLAIHRVALDREATTSALSKKVHKQQTFTRVDKNTFGLLKWQ